MSIAIGKDAEERAAVLVDANNSICWLRAAFDAVE